MRNIIAAGVVLAWAVCGAAAQEAGKTDPAKAEKGKAGEPTSKLTHDEVVTKMLAMLDEMATSLKAVKDADTAKEATPPLKKLAADFIALRKQSQTMTPPTAEEKEKLEKEHKKKLEESARRLLNEVQRVRMIDAASDLLREIRGVFDAKKKQ